MKRIIFFVFLTALFVLVFTVGGALTKTKIDNINAYEKEMYEQLNIGDYYQIRCICNSSCDDHHIVQIKDKRKQDISGKYVVDIRIVINDSTDKCIDFTYDVGTFMNIFEPIKIEY